jgi:hypothetical protein
MHEWGSLKANRAQYVWWNQTAHPRAHFQSRWLVLLDKAIKIRHLFPGSMIWRWGGLTCNGVSQPFSSVALRMHLYGNMAKHCTEIEVLLLSESFIEARMKDGTGLSDARTSREVRNDVTLFVCCLPHVERGERDLEKHLTGFGPCCFSFRKRKCATTFHYSKCRHYIR